MKLRAAPGSSAPLFVGVADSADVARYLSDVAHTTVVDTARLRSGLPGHPGRPAGHSPGGRRLLERAGQRQQHPGVTWPVNPGDWTLVVMNADGSAGVSTDAAIGATFPGLGRVITALFVVGGLLLLVAGA